MSRIPSHYRVPRGMIVVLLVCAIVGGGAFPAHGASISLGAPLLANAGPVERGLTLARGPLELPAGAPTTASVQAIDGADPTLHNVAAIDAGPFHACVLLTSGAVQCWGDEDYIGRTPAGSTNRPVNIESSGRAFTQISAGFDHTCGVTVATTVMCWGGGLFGQLGNDSGSGSALPVHVTDLGNVKSVAAGNSFTCALTNAGEVWCWGYNGFGQLGGATTEGAAFVPIKVPGLSGIKAIGAGDYNVCVITAVGAVTCWGRATPILGVEVGGAMPTPQEVPVLTGGATAVAVGLYFACAIVSNSAQCWGKNQSGELGQGHTSSMETIPAVATGLDSGVTALSLGDDHACAVQNQALKCWGNNLYGTVGNGTGGNGAEVSQSVPVLAAGLQSGVAGVGLGAGQACAVLIDGTARCWGRTENNGLGNGGNPPLSPPVKVSALVSATTVVDAGFDTTCAVSGGAAKCWGAGTIGQLGNGDFSDSATPVQVTGLISGVTDVGAGTGFNCAAQGAEIKCWGYNAKGQLGDDSNLNRTVPSLAATGSNLAVSGGNVHTCAAINDSAFCWGEGLSGRLGNSDTVPSNVPVGVTGFSPGPIVSAIDAGGDHSCLVTPSDAGVTYLYCWGANGLGQLGDGTITNRLIPAQVRVAPDGIPVSAASIQVSTGNGFTCASFADANFDGAAKCWGANYTGQLGTGTFDTSAVPAQVSGLATGVTAISAGNDHACAIASGIVRCWGSNYTGQLGNDSMGNALTPVQVVLPSGATAVSAGGTHTCAIVGADLYCWGKNDRGQVGVPPSSVPQIVVAGDPQPYKLTLAVDGGGSVSSSPSGINCGTACVAVYLPGENVNLTSSPFPGGAFLQWGGPCSGSAVTCQVAMNADITVSANFKHFYNLEVTVQGSGLVTSSPSGLSCASLCAINAVQGTSYTLTATPGTGQRFVEWIGECGGEDETCTVTLTEDLATTAVFTPQHFAVIVHRSGEGLISINPGNINCGSPDCSGSFAYQTQVTLDATPEPGWAFDGWSGACTGKATTCNLSMTQTRNVEAKFIYVNNNLDPEGLFYRIGFAYPQDAPHLFGAFFYTGTVDAGDVLRWSVNEGGPNHSTTSAAPAGVASFRITNGGELVLDDPNIARGGHTLTVSLSDGRGSSITREVTVKVVLRVFAPLVDSK